MAPERVCDYPRPPRLEPSDEHIRVVALGQTLVAQTEVCVFKPSSAHLLPATGRDVPEILKAVGGRPSF